MGNCCDSDDGYAPPPQPVLSRVPVFQQPTSQNGSVAHASQVLQIENICATEPRFCLQQGVTLLLREKSFSWSGDDFKVIDATSGVLYFTCDGQALSFQGKKHLFDNLGRPVVNMEKTVFSFNDEFTLYRGVTTDWEICQFRTNWSWLGGADIFAEFSDVISRRYRFIKMSGDWRNKVCSISLGDPAAGGIPIGRIFRPTTTRTFFTGSDDYFLEIAAGIDIALLVMMCIALDEHKHD